MYRKYNIDLFKNVEIAVNNNNNNNNNNKDSIITFTLNNKKYLILISINKQTLNL